MSHRDYWVVKFDNDRTMLVSRDSETRRVFASLADLGPLVPPTEVEFDPDMLAVGAVMEADNGRTSTITHVTKIPALAVTMPPEA